MITDQQTLAVKIMQNDFGMDKYEIVDNFAAEGITIFLTDVPQEVKRIHCIEFNGVKRTASDWARLVGMNEKTLLTRINRGWPIERALTQKVTKGKPMRRTA